MHQDLMNLSWIEYEKLIKNSEPQKEVLTERIAVLAKSREFFSSHSKFSEMSLIKRRAIAGVASVAERRSEELGNLNWGYFGSMRGFGVYPNVLDSRAVDADRKLTV